MAKYQDSLCPCYQMFQTFVITICEGYRGKKSGCLVCFSYSWHRNFPKLPLGLRHHPWKPLQLPWDFDDMDPRIPPFGLLTLSVIYLTATGTFHSFLQVKYDIANQPNEFEMVDFVWRRFRAFLGGNAPPPKTAATNLNATQPTDDVEMQSPTSVNEFPGKVDKWVKMKCKWSSVFFIYLSSVLLLDLCPYFLFKSLSLRKIINSLFSLTYSFFYSQLSYNFIL